MTLYFVDVIQDRVLFTDDEGVQVDPGDLRVEVCRQLGELVRDWAPGLRHLDLMVSVRVATGAPVMTGVLRYELDDIR